MFERRQNRLFAWISAKPIVIALIAVAPSFAGACAAPALPTEQDWTTVYRGSGNVPCRVVNGYQIPITLRFKDFHDNIDAQITLEAGRADTIYLPPGPVSVILHSDQKGAPSQVQSRMFTVPSSTIGVDWRFFPGEQ